MFSCLLYSGSCTSRLLFFQKPGREVQCHFWTVNTPLLRVHFAAAILVAQLDASRSDLIGSAVTTQRLGLVRQSTSPVRQSHGGEGRGKWKGMGWVLGQQRKLILFRPKGMLYLKSKIYQMFVVLLKPITNHSTSLLGTRLPTTLKCGSNKLVTVPNSKR